jgi:hypothetical protein
MFKKRFSLKTFLQNKLECSNLEGHFQPGFVFPIKAGSTLECRTKRVGRDFTCVFLRQTL